MKRQQEKIGTKDSLSGEQEKPAVAPSSPRESFSYHAERRKWAKNWRLVIRNIDFKATEEDLKRILAPYGTLWELCLPKKPGQTHHAGFGFAQFAARSQAAQAMKELTGTLLGDRNLTVAYALSKSVYEHTHKEAAKDSKTSQKSAPSLEKKRKSKAATALSSKIAPVDRDEEMQRTVFVRNVPYDAEEDDLAQIFSKFGPVASSYIVYDKETGESRGVAFVLFKDQETAKTCLQHVVSTGGGILSHQQDRKSTIFTQPDSDLVLKGRPLQVVSAVKKEEVEMLKEQHHRTKTDKRHLELLNEGRILSGTPEAEGLSKSDLLRRELAEREKKAKLKDPNYAVSCTRLCFRNLPLRLDEKQLKELTRKAVTERQLQPDCPEQTLPNFHSKVHIRQVKLVRSKDRIDKTTGALRSKGYAFVEFSEHVHALICLRQLNNHPTLFGDKRRPIIEFAIDNRLILKKREERNKKQHLPAATASNHVKSSPARLPPAKGLPRVRNTKTHPSLISSPLGATPSSQPIPVLSSHRPLPVQKDTKPLHRPKPTLVSTRKRKEHQEETHFQELVHSYKRRFLSDASTGTRSHREKRWFE